MGSEPSRAARNPLLTRYQPDDAAPGESPHLVRRHDPLLLRIVAQPGPDARQDLVGVLGRADAVEADDEDVPELRLVRGVRGGQREVRGGCRVGRQRRGGLGGERLGAFGEERS